MSRPLIKAPATVAVYSNGETIGDALYKIPFAKAVRAAFPQSRILWLGTFDTALATKLQPVLGGVIDEFHAPCLVGADIRQLILPLPWRGPIDVLIDTQKVAWRTLVARRLRPRLFVSATWKFRFSDRRPAAGYVKPPHIVDRLLDLLELASGLRPPPVGALTLPDDLAAKAVACLPGSSRAGGTITYVGLAPGAGKPEKIWPLDRFIAVAQAQVARGRVPVFILGPDEVQWLPALREALPGAVFPEQMKEVWAGKFSPLNTIALARLLSAAIANDSGVSHMFGAADVPLLTLHGPTNAEKFRPKVTRGATLAAASFGGEAMELIPLDAAVAAMESLFDGGSRG